MSRPIHLRRVVLRRPWAEEHGIRESGMEIDVREAGERERIGRTRQRAQLLYVALGLDILALVLSFGIDHQAIGAVLDRLIGGPGLADRVVATDELPPAYAQAGAMQGRNQAPAELRPVTGPVTALDLQGADPVAPRARDDRRNVAAVRLRDVPDPHSASDERVRLGTVGGAMMALVPMLVMPGTETGTT